MTDQQFKIANEKMKEIQEIEKFIKAFKEPYMNDIHAVAFGRDDRECGVHMTIDRDSEFCVSRKCKSRRWQQSARDIRV